MFHQVIGYILLSIVVVILGQTLFLMTRKREVWRKRKRPSHQRRVQYKINQKER